MIRDPIAPLRPDFQARLRKESPQTDVAPAETTEAAPVMPVQQPRVRRSAHIPSMETAASAPKTRRYGEQGIDVVGDSLPDLLNRINRSGVEAAVREEGPSRVQIASLRRRMTEGPGLVARLRITEGRLAAPTSASEVAEAEREHREGAQEAKKGDEAAQQELRAEQTQQSEGRREVQLQLQASDEARRAEASVRKEEQREAAAEDAQASIPPAESQPANRQSKDLSASGAVAPPGSLVDVLG